MEIWFFLFQFIFIVQRSFFNLILKKKTDYFNQLNSCLMEINRLINYSYHTFNHVLYLIYTILSLFFCCKVLWVFLFLFLLCWHIYFFFVLWDIISMFFVVCVVLANIFTLCVVKCCKHSPFCLCSVGTHISYLCCEAL